ncbi:hypothetical protein K4L06_06205 [Lysobacter sp. BMK333-48F3]|uniref:hypothetical protein n=1 Tax=Lysobacter sp. BMK333-48F3 TaxID=2867962 RepID=UPI001C8B36FC|nr:hypothetical protein [Lysobacter sp. BMK333-48F3]MBX9400899.1 hypothetical protein [Lysobacter sp. BMK333-48F3]
MKSPTLPAAPLLLLASLTACGPGQPAASRPTTALPPNTKHATLAADPKNATYTIEGKPVRLVDGFNEEVIVPGSASTSITRYAGRELKTDLNGDHRNDTVFLLTQDNGGSGTFYYAAAALSTPQGYLGTNAVFVGDRIKVRSVEAEPGSPAAFWVAYDERTVQESDSPVMRSSKIRWDGYTLVDAEAASGERD